MLQIGGRSSRVWIIDQINRLRDLIPLDLYEKDKSNIYSVYTFLMDTVHENKLASDLLSVTSNDDQKCYLLDKLDNEMRSNDFSDYIEAYIEAYLEEKNSPGIINERFRSLGQNFFGNYVKRAERILVNNSPPKLINEINIIRIKAEKYENDYYQLYLIALDKYKNINISMLDYLKSIYATSSICNVTVTFSNGKSMHLTYDKKEINED